MVLDVLLLTLEQLAVIFIFIGAGFFFGKRKLLPEDTGTSLSRLILNLFIPCMSFISVAGSFSLEKIRIYGIIFVAGTVLLFLTIPLAILVEKKFPGSEIEKMTAGYSMVLPNYGYIGYPLVLAVFGQEALSMFIIFALPFSFYFGLVTVPRWTQKGKPGGKQALLNLLTPMTAAVILGVLWGLFSIPLPSILKTACDSASGCVMATTMLVTGLAVARVSMKKMFAEKRAYVIALIRLILLPLAVAGASFGISRLFGLDATLLTTAGAFAAMPLGMNPVVLAEMQGKDGGFGAECAMVSLILSIITLPAVFEGLSLIARLLT